MTPPVTTGPTKGSVRTVVVQALAIGVGVAVGQYTGLHLLIPLSATAAVWWLGKKWLSADKNVIVAVLAVNAGQFLWLALALALRGVLNADVADLIVFAIGLVWLVAKPSAGPLYLLGAYQAVSLAVNAFAFVEAAVGSDAHKALLVHLIWRSWP